MPRNIVKMRAIVLRTMRMGETSRLVTFYAEDYGKLKATAKGARKPKSKFGAALDLMTEVQAICYVKETRDLQTLTECTLLKPAPDLSHSLERLSFGSAACELIDRLTIEGEANPRLYQCLAGVLNGLAKVDQDQVESLFWYYQLRAAEALGYRPQLRQCISCQSELIGPWLWFSAALGGGICAACGQENGVRMARQSLNFLAALQGLKTYGKDTLPQTPPQRGEIRAALRGFLEYHGGARGRLRSLDFLDALNGVEPAPPT